MAPQSLIFFLLLSGYALASVAGEDTEFGRPLDRKTLGLYKKEKLSHFTFYWHQKMSGSNTTSASIVAPISKYSNSTSFGLVQIFDNPLTLGPKLNSKLVGRAEGFFASTSQSEVDFLMIQTFNFIEGKYNGSAISILGRNVAFAKIRELPVVGGSGLFRYAKGYAVLTTYFEDPKTRDAIIEYNVYVSHY
ncbi:hypothetical protein TanjilG_12810 [Lupinus angustifolius]|uniref:Dirigent protein n=1 Tax=Lupinus angustifolius TaxID=3871 RepID=A0A1J7HGL7_LUPAN|nr:PREDICTED: dirigent protein 22-like [Lupinus angustifolius]OIW00869.1 hypothetical protein TanjilG_12810 [Lupinus angustifolius]